MKKICSRLNAVLLVLFFRIIVLNGQEAKFYKEFVFGNIENRSSAISIRSNISYDTVTGYGFDFNTSDHVIMENNASVASFPVYFSVDLPEGNYKIDITLGSNKQASCTTVKAESRRLMLNQLDVPKDGEITKTILVNVRTPRINDTISINTKKRESTYLNWDHKLTLEFLGNWAVKSIQIQAIEDITTLFLAGDSTVTDQDLEPWASWGQFFTAYVNKEYVVSNYAESGASLSSFKARKRLDKIISLLKKGDYVFIAFGHNDQKQKGNGIGPWQSYTDLLIEFADIIRQKGGIPILITPTQRRFFTVNNTLQPTHGAYPDAMRVVAKKMKIPLIDLTKMTTVLYENWGDEISKKAFVQYPAHTFSGQKKELKDNTHFNNYGAHEIALCIIQSCKDLGLNDFLKDTIPQYTPKHPTTWTQWLLPMSQRFEPVQPDGN